MIALFAPRSFELQNSTMKGCTLLNDSSNPNLPQNFCSSNEITLAIEEGKGKATYRINDAFFQLKQ